MRDPHSEKRSETLTDTTGIYDIDINSGQRLGELKGTQDADKGATYFIPHRFVRGDTLLVERRIERGQLTALQFWSVNDRKQIGSVELDRTEPAGYLDCDYDGIYCIVARKSGMMALYEVSSMNQAALLQGHRSAVYSTSYSGGQWLCSASLDGTVRFWDLTNHTLLKTITIPVSPVEAGKVAADLSSDRRYLALAANAKAYLVETESGRVVQIISDYSSVPGFAFNGIKFSSDNNAIIAIGRAGVGVLRVYKRVDTAGH